MDWLIRLDCDSGFCTGGSDSRQVEDQAPDVRVVEVPPADRPVNDTSLSVDDHGGRQALYSRLLRHH